MSSQNTGSGTKRIGDMIYMYTCEHMYVNQEVLSVRTRKGIDICNFMGSSTNVSGICMYIEKF